MFKFRKDLTESIIAKGIDVHVALPVTAEDEWIVGEFEGIGAKVHKISMSRTGMNPFRDLQSLVALWRLIKSVQPSHVLSYTIKPVIYGSLAARFASVPNCYALITGLGFMFESAHGRGTLGRLARRMYRIALSDVDSVIFQNPDDEKLFFEQHLIRPTKKTCVVNGSGVDIEHFSPTQLPKTPSFLLIARLLGAKGIREYVCAARRIQIRGLNATFAVVGWLDQNNPDSITQQELDSWIADGVIQFLGKQSDVRPAIQCCSVYVLPSYREGTSRTTLEAMSMGRPIITTDTPGCRETVIDGENGFLVPVKAIDELEEAMLRFIEKPDLAERMGRFSRKLAEEKYDVRKVNDVMLRELGIN